MASVFDVAKYILEKTGSMSTMKLQKLCYYSQAWSVAWTERPLFHERIEAWINGPVCPALFAIHKKKFMIRPDDIPHGNADALDADQADTVDKVLEYYGDWSPYELREQTHCEAPWKDARKGVPDDQPSDMEITVDSMGAYYGNL